MVKSEERKGIFCPKCPANFFFTENFEQHLQNEHFMHTTSEVQKVTAESPSSEDLISSLIKVEPDPLIAETSTCYEGCDDFDNKDIVMKCEQSSDACSPIMNPTSQQIVEDSVKQTGNIKCENCSSSTGTMPLKCDKSLSSCSVNKSPFTDLLCTPTATGKISVSYTHLTLPTIYSV